MRWQRDGVSDPPTSIGYCTAKSSLDMKPLQGMVPKDLLRQVMGGVLMIGDHAPFRIGLDAAVMVDSPRQPFDGLKPICVCRTYYAAHALATYLQSLLKKRPIGR